ncbi:GTP-binding protein 1 isoform X2 [Colletes latitarsis]|uniref:GTP-binding protein 1 isoform X2 n=1 Tax=Colletes latitarsis TaxID=2605962 RepID=UPI00403568CF
MAGSGSIIIPTIKQLHEKDHVPTSNIDYSSIRGKSVLVSPSEDQYELLLRRLKERIQDGGSETIFDIGIGEDGSEDGLKEDEYEASVATLQSLAATLEADCVLLRQNKVDQGLVGQYLVRQRLDRQDFLEIRVAVVGNVDAGKSTLLGVLTHGELDNGRGLARQKLFRHKHEAETGRTSSVGNDILGFDSVGNVVNKPEHGSLDWVKICEKSSKVITFIDLAGHERYLKTTVFGMTGHAPDFGCRKVPVTVKTPDDVVVSATNFVSERLCPIFQVSNVTGENLNLLKMFLNLLTARITSHDDEPAEFQIDDTYSVPGVGTVISGTTLKGVIKLNDTLLLGPDPLGRFIPIAVKSIHRKRMPVREVRGGQTASFALKKIKRSQIRKGMVMVAPALNPQACWEFEGEILVLHHPTTISSCYQAMVHCGSIRQTASIISMSQDCLRTGDKALVRFRFIKHPEYIKPGQRMVFREGRTKAVGNVLKLIPYSSTTTMQTSRSNKPNKTSQNRQSSSSMMQSLDATETSSSFEGQSSKQENMLQKSGMNQNKKNRGRKGGRSHNTVNNIIQPLSEQNPPTKV